jgi:subtilisin family serine protease
MLAILANVLFASPKQHYIVRYKSNPSSLSLQGIPSAKLMLSGSTKIDHTLTLDDATKDATLEKLRRNPNVEFIEPVYPVHLYSQPNDTWYKNQTYLNDTDLNLLSTLPAQHDTIVAVLDTGVDIFHDELAGQFYENPNEILNGIDDDGNGLVDDISGYNFLDASEGGGDNNPQDGHGHGTHISGIIAAKTNNFTGIAGINPDTKILPVKFINNLGIGTQLDAALAIRYAVDMGADVINCSWGFYSVNTILREAVQYALDNDVIVVAAIGNSGSSAKEYPAALDGVFTIGASNINQNRSYFSSYGEHLDFLIYGKQLFSTDVGNTYGFKSGTSQSAAVMSGVVSKLLAYDNTTTPERIYDLIKQNSSDSALKTSTKGYGTLNTASLLSSLGQHSDIQTIPLEVEPEDVESLSLTRVLNFPNPIQTSTTFGFETNTAGASAKITIYDINGAEIESLDHTTVSGYNRVSWTPSGLANGSYMYIVELSSAQGDELEKGVLTVLK